MMDNKSNITLSVFVLFVSLFALISNNGVDGSHQEYPEYYHNLHHNVEVKAVHKTGYHFQPPKNWINDPNGPMYYKGLYHLFYQYNPKAAIWGNIVWAHSVSKDLINWEALEPAIESTEFFDMNGCWSGSATMVQGGNPVILYTGRNPQLYNVQNYAIPANLSDPYLRKWIKPDDNPLIEPTQMINHTSFRDPTTAWFVDGRWKIALGSQHDDTGIAYLYTSKDFKNWVKADHPLHTKDGTGNWECPDFYPVSLSGEDGLDTSVYGPDVKHVFKVSLDKARYEYYTIGTYDRQKDMYIPDEGQVDGWAGLRYDYGNFYASKSFYDPVKSRRILWAWVNESDFMGDPNKPLNDITKGWAGIQTITIPRKVWADLSGKQLLQWPVEELETLRGQSVELSNVKLSEGDHFQVQGITAAQADVDVTFSFASLDRAEPLDPKWNNENAWNLCREKGAWNKGGLGPFGLKTLASLNLKEYTPVFFRIYKVETGYKALMCSDATRSSKSPGLYMPVFGGLVDVDLSNKTLSIRSLIDNSVVESFGAGGKIVITSRVYPKYAVSKDAHLFVFNNGKEPINIDRLNGWSMNKPVMNEPVKQ